MKKYLLFLFIIPMLGFSIHKYYLALTEIEYKPETQSVQMIMNVFMDDIEIAINKDYILNLQLASKDEPKNVDEYFFNYLKEHFKISINNQEMNYKYIGKEYNGDIIFFYLEIDNVSEVKTIEIQNDILTKHFSDQKNLIKAKVNGDRKSLILTKKNDKGLLKF
ncbi:hypothetical protein C7447_102477 [Tenacibaculum adriaticum]|uniref:Peptidase E n=1 Tax=Tenacibaculum adriaticum TaxID=413713 RepID=A0A5S5DV61_9FLAO|nr:DUF6702 family protein [Tenacibaculum adriaticum]TYP99158.1 hypothetical protein C7447_102477 [Tenacibaculum adriaticum]